MWIIIYILLGFVIAMINCYLFAKIEKLEGKSGDYPIMIFSLILWVLFWPIGLVNTVDMSIELLRRKYEN